jgi:ATP-dependent Lon protease
LAANVLDTIPAPLLDRMEVLEVSGYVSDEKLAIADRYLSPQAKEASGLKDTDIKIEPEAIEALIRYYCRESGVRNLKKHIDKVSWSCRKTDEQYVDPKLSLDLPQGSFPHRTGPGRKRSARTSRD